MILGFDFKAMSKYDARLKEWYERTNGGKLDEVSDTKLQIVEHGGEPNRKRIPRTREP